MTCLQGLVREYTAAGEAALQDTLRNWLLAGSVRNYLPQTWILLTDQESLAIHVDAEGHFSVQEGQAFVRDGAITIRHDALAGAIREGKPPPANSYQVTFYTEKGKEAFEHLAKYFGL